MAKVISPLKLSGSLGGLTFYENEYGPQVKEKGGPTEWQVKNLDRFANTRHNAAEWKRATAASRLTRLALGNLRDSVKGMRLSGRMIGRLLAVLKSDPVHDWGERVVAAGDLSLLAGFEFNYNLSLEEALPINIVNCFSLEAGKVAVNIPAFRLRKKKGLPVDATHYRLVSCILSIDFEKKTYRQDKQVGELQAMGRKAGAPFCIEQVVQPDNEQGCFWLMGIEFYKMVNEKPVLVRGGALRVMEWIGKASSIEDISVVPAVADKESYKAPNEVLAKDCVAAGTVETDVEEIGAAYREYMEEVLAAACADVMVDWVGAITKEVVATPFVEEAGAAYREAMEEVLATCLERVMLVEVDANMVTVEQSAPFPEPDVVEGEVTAAVPVDRIADVVDVVAVEPVAGEDDEVLIGVDEEFEKSLRVLLPVEGSIRKGLGCVSHALLRNSLLLKLSIES